MRVISGSARGLVLVAPAGEATRPTADRMKEALFSMAQPFISDAAVLDLFAGSGALGIEALSRGAARAVFVEHDQACADVVRKNLDKARFGHISDVMCADYKNALLSFKHNKEQFNLILLDPPYGLGLAAKALCEIERSRVLAKDGVIILETESGAAMTDTYGFSIFKKKEYKTTGFVFLEAQHDCGVPGDV